VRRRAEDSARSACSTSCCGGSRPGPSERRRRLAGQAAGEEESATRQKFRKKLREGELDDREVEIEVSAPQAHMRYSPRRNGGATQQIQGMFQNLGGGRRKLRRMKIREAIRMLTTRKRRVW